MASRLIEWVLQVKDETGPALDGAAEGAENAADKLDDLTESQVDAEKAAGRSKEIMEGFAGALDRVSPAAGAAVRGVGALAGGMKSAAAATGLSLSLLGPLTVAVGLLAGAYLGLSAQLDKTKEKMDAARESVQEMASAVKDLERAEIQAAVAAGRMNEAQALQALSAMDAADQWKFLTDRIEGNRIAVKQALETLQTQGSGPQAFNAVKQQLSALEDAGQGASAAAGILRGVLAGEFGGYEGALDKLRNSLVVLGSQQEVAATLVKRTTTAMIEQGTSADATSKIVESASKTAEAATRDYAAESEAALDALGAIRADLTADIISEEEKLRSEYQATIDSIKELTDAAEGDLVVQAQALAAIDDATANYQRRLAELAAAQQGVAAGTDAMTRSGRGLEAAQAGVGIAQAGVSGGAAGVAGKLGPIGAIVAAVLGILESVGELGAQGIGDRLEQTNENIVKGIRELPELLGEVLPEIGNDFLEALITALGESLDDLAVSIFEGTIEATFFVLTQLPRILVDAIRSVVTDLWDRITSGTLFGEGGSAGSTLAAIATGGISELFRGSKDSGAMSIDRTGLYVVHQGEEIVQRNGRSTQSSGGGMSPGGGIQVVTTGVVAPGFMDLLSDAIREAQARGLVFG